MKLRHMRDTYHVVVYVLRSFMKLVLESGAEGAAATKLHKSLIQGNSRGTHGFNQGVDGRLLNKQKKCACSHALLCVHCGARLTIWH